MHQQFESPASVVATVRRIWKPTFDAMATPFSAVCGAYATLEDDVLARAVIPPGAIVYANPAYAPQDMANGAAGLEVHLRKLVEVDVRARGCTLVALLPILSHTRWYDTSGSAAPTPSACGAQERRRRSPGRRGSLSMLWVRSACSSAFAASAAVCVSSRAGRTGRARRSAHRALCVVPRRTSNSIRARCPSLCSRGGADFCS
mmetsp:Transcript_25534/g.80027  ORF Transcript_25534/g.80027 Transcript_25534/m.80027 type:complete len:203 (+) Transcript_25534:571-1179(+)